MKDLTRSPDYAELVHPTPDWFHDAKLGIFIHWGLYSTPAWAEPTGELGTIEPRTWMAHNPYAEWYYNTIRIPGSPAAQHHQEVYGGRPYDDFLEEWTAESFDADALLAAIKATGARYVVPTTKHHDGVTLWDAPDTNGRNTVARGPRRDLIGELATATRAAGLRFGVYYSGGLDWNFDRSIPAIDDDIDDAHRPLGADYAEYAYRHGIDLIDRYRPDIFWNDIEWPDAGKAPGTAYSLLDLYRRLYAANPEAVANDRQGDTHWDYRTGEYEIAAQNEPGEAWEQCRGIGYSFGYNQLEDERQLLSGPDAVRMFVDVVSRGGNLLLNIGPTAAGLISELQQRTLTHLGDWNAANGEAIFGSRMLSGDAPRATGDGWVRWTAQDGTVYAFVEPGTTTVEGVDDAIDAGSATALDGTPVTVARDGATLTFETGTPALDGPVAVKFSAR